MIVTRIEEMTKSRCSIFLEDEFAFVLYKGELRHFGVQEGKELPEESYHAIMEEVLPKRAKLRAMNLLKGRPYTVKQLEEKLKAGGYPPACIQAAIEYVASYQYVDDDQYALDYIQTYESRKTKRRMEQDLASKGISKEAFLRAWETWEAKNGGQDEDVMIQALLEKKGYCAERADQKEQQKVFAFLMRKGFSSEAVRKALF
jgi:regulatory protein